MPTLPLSSEEKLDFQGGVGPEVGGLPDFCCAHGAPALPKPDLAVPVELVVFSLTQSDLWFDLSDALLTVNDCHNF